MAIFLTKDSKVIVQGMTGSEGTKHTTRMLAAGTNIVGGVNPRKAGEKADFDGKSVPVFNDKHLSWRWEWAKEIWSTCHLMCVARR